MTRKTDKGKDKFKCACERAVASGKSNRFTDGCRRRYPDLETGKGATTAGKRATAAGKQASSSEKSESLSDQVTEQRKRRRKVDVPEACRLVLSEKMKTGNKSEAFRSYWKCRRRAAEP